MEDNDPQGYKSNVAKDVKDELKIKAMKYPCYSPDLNPLDFFIWQEVQRRLSLKDVGQETADAYKARLRRVAMAIPQALIRKVVLTIRDRAKAVVQAKGGHIPRD